MNECPQVFVINLDKREDRMNHVKTELENAGFSYERFSATCLSEDVVASHPIAHAHISKGLEYIKGSLGCKLSHIAVCKIAKKRNYKYYVVVEDDIEFTVDNPMSVILSSIREVEEIDPDWHILFGGLSCAGMFETYKNIGKVKAGGSTVCMIVNHTYYDMLIESENIEPFEIDSYNYKMMSLGHMYCILPMIAVQMDSFSDIIGKNVSYKILYIVS